MNQLRILGWNAPVAVLIPLRDAVFYERQHEVDPSLRMADVERSNNRVDLDANMKPFADPTK
jgi:hypothetical protein